METINNELMSWLHQWGVADGFALWMVRAILVLAIVLII